MLFATTAVAVTLVIIKEIEWVRVDRVHLAQDKNNWRALVSVVTNVRGGRKFLAI